MTNHYFKIALFSSIVVVLIGIYVAHFLNYDKTVLYNDDDCILLSDIGPGSEDIVIIDNNLALVSSGDLNRIAFPPSKQKKEDKQSPGKNGGIFAIQFVDNDSSGIKTEKVEIVGYPPNQPFNPHGIYFSNETQHLYAVNHECGEKTYEGIEIFKLEMRSNIDTDNSSVVDTGHRSNIIQLIYKRSIQSPTFPLGGMNDVVEGSYYGEIYVTQWLSHAIPDSCVGDENFYDETKRKVDTLFRKLTNVQRCLFDDNTNESKGVYCHVVLDGFHGANGISKNPNNPNTYYVIDAPDKKLHVLEKYDGDGTSTGVLRRKNVIPLPHASDNIEYDMSSGKLTTVGTPYIYEAIKRLSGDISINVSGGMITIDFENKQKTKQSRESSYIIEEILMHNGSKLSMLSAAVFMHGKILLGSPCSDGVLVCPIPSKVLSSKKTTI